MEMPGSLISERRQIPQRTNCTVNLGNIDTSYSEIFSLEFEIDRPSSNKMQRTSTKQVNTLSVDF